MQYMLMIYEEEAKLDDDVRDACYVESTQLAHDLVAAGKFIATAPLHSVKTATSVQVRGGKRMVTDGPFAETREQLGGFFLIEAENLDEAIAVATRIPSVKRGTVEIRPVVQLSGLPEG